MWANASGVSNFLPRFWRLSAFAHEWMSKARTAAVPFRLGEAVVGDDPFNGRNEGLVATKRGSIVGLRTNTGIIFYDYRHLRRQD